jgi:uncharacterized membrane protein YvlD (DUF360 family)
MIRFLVRTLVMLLANAIGLVIASVVLDGFDLNAAGFITAVVIFTVVLALLTPFLANQFRKRQSAALGGVALIATLLSLIITAAISDGLSISGIGTWVAAAVIVWLVALLAAFLLPYLGLKKYMETKRD